MAKKRTKKMTDDHAALIKRLGALNKQKSTIITDLTAVEEQIRSITTALAEDLAEGSYTVGKWICRIKDTFSKGRKNTKWKSVAETLNSGVDIVSTDMAKKYPEAESLLGKLARKLHKIYDDSYATETTVGADSSSTSVVIERLSSKK